MTAHYRAADDLPAYESPRWSQEITDCSMPLTLDQYSRCGYDCQYCFAYFRKAIGNTKARYLSRGVGVVDVNKVKRVFTDPEYPQFGAFTRQRLAVQWGGMADPFCPLEHRYGVGLELIEFFRELRYPISFSTKGTWWTEDARYVEQFKGADHFHVKMSIITTDKAKAAKIERGVPGPALRLKAIERMARWGIGGITLRLRPFILGVSTPSYLELIRQAADAGAEAVSTEFLCVELRTPGAKARYRRIGKLAGYPLIEQYQLHSPGQSGYLRGSRGMKAPFMRSMQAECERLGLRFYVSDAHFKEMCVGASCCGLRESWNYSRGQFTQALLIAKERGRVMWSDIAPALEYARGIPFTTATGFNQTSSEKRGQFHSWSMFDWLHYLWNHVNGPRGPYKYFGGVLLPAEDLDAAGDVVYVYNGEAA